MPGTDTRWTATGDRLTVGQPVRLSWDNGQGQLFGIDLSVDENFLFTARQTVANRGGRPVTVTPYGYVSRTGRGADVGTWINHVGPIGAFGEAADYGVGYDDVAEAGSAGVTPDGAADWVGFSDKYWAAVLVPPAGASARFQTGRAADSFQATATLPAAVVQPGTVQGTTSRVFAGAKEVDLLAAYADGGIPKFDLLIDWGWFAVVERPFFWLLKTIEGFTGNWGLAIILLTVLVRLLMFPIAQRQFASMAAMRRLQPKLKSLQERHKDNKEKLQKEMMQLYKTEKVNPLAGCLPIVIQIPVFFALYKVLVLVVELRHQPFALWIHDLSAPDPATPLNGFGTFGFTLPHLLAIGVLPILVGITQWLSFKQNPAARRDAGEGVRHHALGADVRDGPVRGRFAALLDDDQRLHRVPAAADVRAPSGTEEPAQAGLEQDRFEQGGGQGEVTTEERERQLRQVFSGPIAFLKSAPRLEFLPDPTVAEVAFAGRSNVGKSSLLNALTNRNGLARTSVTPGRTQELNIFDVGDPLKFRLVDMPGYGFAKAPPAVVRQWRFLVNDYLRGRAVLKRALVLIDARRGVGEVDREVLAMLDTAAVSYRLVLTKSDKVKASEAATVLAAVQAEARRHAAAHPDVISTSVETGDGIDLLRAAVLEAVEG